MIRIGIDASRAVTDRRTGTEAYAQFLLQHLIPLATAVPHHLTLYFNQPPPSDLFSEETAVSHAIIPFPRLWTHVRLAQELHQRPPDVFFTPAHVIPLTYRGPAVATVHDLGYVHFPEAHPWRQRAYLRWSTRHNARRARVVLADSEATKADLVRFEQIDPAKIKVVYPGADPALQPVRDGAQRTAVLRKYGIQSPYLLYLSTLQPRKNLLRLLQAYAASGVNQPLVLAGKPGWLSAPIVAAAERHERVQLIGYVDDADKATLLSAATALLYPSLYEGFGFPVLEAQACGTAVLTANSSSLPELAGDSALLVDPHDTNAIAAAIRQLAHDNALRQQLVQAGLANVRRFRWETAAQQTLDALLQAAA